MISKTIYGGLAVVAVAALLYVFSPSQKPLGAEGFPQEPLPALSGQGPVSLAACPTEKCLTVYVAPWCGYCRASTRAILELKKYLLGKNVVTRVVVGLDQEDRVRDYARDFGPETLLDLSGAVTVQGGVPHFYVSDRAGQILKEVAGVPQGGIQDLPEFAAYFGLP